MESHPAGETDDAVVDPARDWMIYRCSHGCFHMALDRLMVTLTEDEFHLLQDLMRRASRRFEPQLTGRGTFPRAH